MKLGFLGSKGTFSYCTDTKMIKNSLPKFKELKEEIDGKC